MGETFACKMLGRAAGRPVSQGETVSIEPDLVLTLGDTGAVIEAFQRGRPDTGVRHPERTVIVLDGPVPPMGDENRLHRRIRRFAAEAGIRHFHEAGTGAGHQVLSESFLVPPGSIVTGTDRRTCMYGALNCYAFSVDASTAAGVWRDGSVQARVPETLDVSLSGGFMERVGARDLALAIPGMVSGAVGRAVEFHGTAVSGLRPWERLTISGMGAELGAVVSVFPADGATEDFFCSHQVCRRALWSDADAPFAGEFHIELDSIVPMTATPGPGCKPVPVAEVPRTAVDVVFLGSCLNGRFEDLSAAADVMKAKKVAPGVRFFVCPASREIHLKALRSGLVETFLLAGAVVLPPGNGVGDTSLLLAEGECCVSTAADHLGDPPAREGARVYLAGPETAAATAVTGFLTDPREV